MPPFCIITGEDRRLHVFDITQCHSLFRSCFAACKLCRHRNYIEHVGMHGSLLAPRRSKSRSRVTENPALNHISVRHANFSGAKT